MYTYEQLAKNYKWDEIEYGLYTDRCTAYHKEDGYFVLAFDGRAIARVYPDRYELLIPKKGMTSGVSTRWGAMIGAHNYEIIKRKRVSGITTYSATFLYQKKTGNMVPAAYNRIAMVPEVTKLSTEMATASQVFIVKVTLSPGTREIQDMQLSCGDTTTAVATKDNTKYRAFNANLKKLRAALTMQAKLGTYDKYGGWGEQREYLQEAFGDKGWFNTTRIELEMTAHVEKWIETNDAGLLKTIGICALYNHGSTKQRGTVEDIVRRINNGLRAVQQRYLRESCVTISESDNSLSLNNESDDQQDQDSVLQPPAGLREVQVSCEAEVC